MHMMILFEDGKRVETILLAAGAGRMRVVVPGLGDTLELRLIQDQWMTEEGDAVDIGLILAGGEARVREFSRGHAA